MTTMSAKPHGVELVRQFLVRDAVVDYIEENLGQPIALRRLAALAGVSARHFERAFRQAVGLPHHAYVLEKRVVRFPSLDRALTHDISRAPPALRPAPLGVDAAPP
jgi:methylphosphotriester-DNA--protein-cysteine methyltransferase